ncbi:hypothetical protein AMTRI_Chr02g257200 [Amborella trichopoda]|uniref:Steroid 5-alpha reductase C-terminal domain-containing protein n=1 Tax=Amborella trichopoda TaxID=13333 RepID=U5DDX5_AMBTC|nr:uncharacterized protein LOC18448007 [Amborella trichopoda]ERN19617.1 hypothetical protein AMTR_s00062p00133590 [Amborella trichopoda]|eukprot:XP_006858150.1 uncharacterized protein LOC18448007 [Amborella trichopoda]
MEVGTSITQTSTLSTPLFSNLPKPHLNSQTTTSLLVASTFSVKAKLSLRAKSVKLIHRNSRFLSPLVIQCSSSDGVQSKENLRAKTSGNLFGVDTSVSFLRNRVFPRILHTNPLEICKWVGIVCIALSATKNTVRVLTNPFFWMYFSWTWLLWPWFLALFLGFLGIFSAYRHYKGKAGILEQLAIVTSTFAWLTLVPAAHFNGFLEGWPIAFFFVYHYFFFFNVSVRKRLYGDYYLRPHNPKWDVRLPIFARSLFSLAILVGHWFAAFEGPPLHQIPGGLSNFVLWGLILLTLFMQYHATLYLSNYSEKVAVPMCVVQFGPYRWVRHPIYASMMLMFATYCAALRAPLSLLFVVIVCILYYDQKAKLEEDLMLKEFGDSYAEYKSKVRQKFIPLVY